MTRDEAIAVIEHSRQTHVEWRDFLTAHDDYSTEDVGDVDHHEQCIAGYDGVIDALRRLAA